MKRLPVLSLGLLLTMSVCTGADAGTPVLDVHPPSDWDPDWNTLNDNLGTDPDYFEIETFEDYDIHPDLMIDVENGTSIILDNTRPDCPWDGEWYLTNYGDDLDDGNDVTFSIVGGTAELGIGISHVNRRVALYVNGELLVEDIRSLSNMVVGDDIRNGYLWIRAAGDEAIHTVMFDENDDGGKDLLLFDHVAWLRPLDGPAHYWPLDCDDSDQITGTPLDVYGAEKLPGKIGMAYLFDGEDDVIGTDIIPQYGPNDSFSWAVWAKMPDEIPDGQMDIMGLESTGQGEIRLFLWHTDGKLWWKVRDDNNDGNVWVSTPGSMADGKWHHLVGIRDADADELRLYVDGVSMEPTAGSPNGEINVDKQRELYLGALNHNGNTLDYFAGMVDEVYIFDYALTEQEILDLIPVEDRCLADIDRSGFVDIDDLFAVLGAWGPCPD